MHPQQRGDCIALAIMLGTFLWARSARPQKCPKPDDYGYNFITANGAAEMSGLVVCPEIIEESATPQLFLKFKI